MLAIHLHHVYSSANAHFLPPSPQIEPERLSPTSVVAIGARTTPPPPCPFELERSPSSTMSIRAQTLVSHFHRVHSSPNACLHLSSSARHHLHRVYSSANTHFPPPSPQIEPERSSPTSVVSIGAQTPPPPPCPFKLKCSPSASTMSIRAQTLVSHLHRLECSPSTSTMSIRAQTLVSHLHRLERSPSTSTRSIRAQTLVSHLHCVYSSPNARHPSQPLPFERNHSFPVFYRCRIFFSIFWIVFEAQFVWVNLSTYMLILLI